MRTAGLLLIAVLGTACTHRHTAPPVMQTGERFTVETRGGAEVSATAETQDGTLFWRSRNTGQRIDPAEVVAYSRRKHGRGLLEGLLLGTAVGGTVGVIAGLASGDDECEPGEWCILRFSAGEKAILGGMALGVLGGVTGGLIGVIIGSTDRYEPGVPRLTVTPGPHGAGAALSWGF